MGMAYSTMQRTVRNASSLAPKPGLSPIKRMLATVLEQAVAEAVNQRDPRCKVARLWIFDDETYHDGYGFTFVDVCEHLALDVQCARKSVTQQMRDGAFQIKKSHRYRVKACDLPKGERSNGTGG